MKCECSVEPEERFRGVIAEIAAALNAAESVLILSHEHPDGDGIGCALALAQALKVGGKRVCAALTGGVPDKYRFLPGSEWIVTDAPESDFAVAVAVDCDGPTRLASLEAAFNAAPVRISIDHHGSRAPFADLNYVDPSAAATGMPILNVLRAMGAEITPDIATCLYAAVATDTGIFRFQNTSAGALCVAAAMAESGASPYGVAQATSEVRPLRAMRLLGRALAALEAHGDGRVAFSAITLEDKALAGSKDEDSEGIIDVFKTVAGAEVYILLREMPDHEWRGSLRSKELDMAAVAARFGGGGHKAAAGFTIYGTKAEVEARVLAAVETALG